MNDAGTGRPVPGRSSPAHRPPRPPEPPPAPALLEILARTLPPTSLDELWIFPARRVGAERSAVIVASAFEQTAPASAAETTHDRRRIITACFTIGRDARGQPELRHELAEQGLAPTDLVARVVDGVIRRLDDEPAPPRHARVGGDPERWEALLRELAGADDPG